MIPCFAPATASRLTPFKGSGGIALTSPHSWLLAVVAGLTLLAVAAPASAQQIQLQLSAKTVEVGQPVTISASASGDGEAPSNPRLRVPPGFSVQGPSVSTSHQISITSSGMKRIQGLTATWQVIPSKEGTFTLGPVTMVGGRGKLESRSIAVKVVAQGSLPKRQGKRRRSPFDPFDDDLFGGSLFGDLDDILGGRRPGSRQQVPPEFQLERAPDPLAFLHATVSKKTVVLGEQVSLKIYAYGSRGRFGELNSREPRHPDFFAENLQERVRNPPTFTVDINGRDFRAIRLRHLALFPLKAGSLEVGPMTMNFYGSRYITSQFPEGLERKSPPLQIEVVEPPAEGRPVGYQLGDVGDYTLTAEVSPRQVEAGGAVSVVATLRGTGLIPSRLLTSDQKGVQWLEPTIKSALNQNKEGLLGGERTFTYVVQLEKEGAVDLGELQLPFYSTTKKRYGTARVKLGQVVVKPSQAKEEPDTTQQDKRLKLSELLQVREYRPAEERQDSMWVDQPWFWPSLLLGPIGIFLAQATRGASLNYLRKRKHKLDSPAHLAQEALKEARAAAAESDKDQTVTPVEKAVFLATEASLGIKPRAFLLNDLQAKLEQELAPDLAKETCQLLKDCDSARFAGETLPTGELVKRAQSVVHALLRKTSTKKRVKQ